MHAETRRRVLEAVHAVKDVASPHASVPASGRSILLCPLELEALTWQDHDLFSRLLQTPHGPEDEASRGET